ncbi:hypothetical protein JMJ76_0011544 [Colletotrichum scovillei]|nr:hypothetical protein JMJ76_0011544 [Colletotrichum scovillei]KAG7082387.1 hypothetical protein JMJ78_0004489 [Colletotrichum scovillei]
MINSCLPLKSRTTDNPVRQLEEKNPIMRHAWLDFDFEDYGVEYKRATVKIYEALSLGNEPSFMELVWSDLMCSTLWARPEQCFSFDTIASDLAPASHGDSRGAFFRVVRSDASTPLDLGTAIDKEIDRVIGKDVRCRNNPEFLPLEFSVADGHRTTSDELHSFSTRDRCLINQSNSDMDNRDRVTYVLRAAVRLRQNGTDGLDQVQVFTQTGEPRWEWMFEEDWFRDPGYTWFLLYWKINSGYRVSRPSVEWADSRIEKNSEGTQDESRHIDDSTKRDENESILRRKNSTSFAVPEQSSSNHGHQIFSLRRPLSGWAPPKQTPDPVTHKLMTGNDFLQRDERNFSVICGHCSARGHALIDCIWPGLTIAKYSRLVWTDIARAYVKHHEGKYKQNPVGYPWTKSFAMEIWKNTFKDANKQFWLTYDYSKDSENQSRLQVDPVTKDWQTALQNEELILEDQKQHGWNAVKYVHR